MSHAWDRTRSEAPRPHGDPSVPRPRPWLFHVFACDAPTEPLAGACCLDEIEEIVIGRAGPAAAAAAASTAPGERRRALQFADHWMSSRHARLERRGAGFWVIDDGSKNGVLVNGDRVDRALLADGDWIEVGHTVLRYRHGELGPVDPADPVGRAGPLGARREAVALASSLPGLQARFRELEDIARSTVSVVLRGETGTGKEVTARGVHALSGRPGELVAVNCGALPATLLESELFGYRKGAFSSATEDRAGLVRAADRGTLFLDEIGDLPLASQAALLRVLQEREVTPVGATRPVKVDLRVISATHRDLEAQVARGELRADLYARLAGHTFALPPLRERREDLGRLVAGLLARIAPDREVRFEPEAVRALCRHGWPLNVRELEKRLASAVVLARGAAIGPDHVGLSPLAVSASAPTPSPPPPAARRASRRDQLVAALQDHRGNVSAAARALGKARSQVQRWIREYQLDPSQYRSE